MALCGAPWRGTTNQHQHETSCQQSAGTSSCDPRTGLRDATLRVSCSGLGRHYFRRAIQLPAFFPCKRPLKPSRYALGACKCTSVAFLRRSKPVCWKLTNSQILRQMPCQARSISAHPPLLLEPQIEVQPREMRLWPRGSVSNMGVVGDLQNPTTCRCWRHRGRYAIARAIAHLGSTGPFWCFDRFTYGHKASHASSS